MFRSVYYFTLTILICACSGPVAKGPEFSPATNPSKGESLIYVYKPYSGDGITLCLNFLLNGKKYGCLEGKGYLEARVPPGDYNLVLQTDTFMGPKIIDYDFHAEAEKTYYFKFVSSGGPAPKEAVDKSVYAGAAISTNIAVAVSGVHWLASEDAAEAEKTLKLLRQSESSL